jgi:hypothetical protein
VLKLLLKIVNLEPKVNLYEKSGFFSLKIAVSFHEKATQDRRVAAKTIFGLQLLYSDALVLNEWAKSCARSQVA